MLTPYINDPADSERPLYEPEDDEPPAPTRAEQLRDEAELAAIAAGFYDDRAIVHFQVGWLSCELALALERCERLRRLLDERPVPDTGDGICPF